MFNSLTEPNIHIKFSEAERCILISALYAIRAKQNEDLYRDAIQKMIEKITHA